MEKLRILHNLYIKNKCWMKRNSYSQDKEDIIISRELKNIKKGFYVDVGCYHPIEINNTALLYNKGWNGINIDISSYSIKLFNIIRPDDLNLNLAVSNKNKLISFFYQKKLSKISTINKIKSKKIFQGKIKIKKIISKSLTKILDETKYKNKFIDFLNIDAEGSDYQVLKSLNFSVYNPKLICIEIYPNNGNFSKFNILKTYSYKFLIKKKYKHIWSGYFSHIFKR